MIETWPRARCFVGEECLVTNNSSPTLGIFATPARPFCLVAKHASAFQVSHATCTGMLLSLLRFARWARRDLNSQPVRDMVLSHARIPIPPLARHGYCSTIYLKSSRIIYVPRRLVPRDNFVAAAPKFPRAWLAVRPAGLTSLRLGLVRKNSAQALFFSSSPPGRIRTYDRLVKSELLYQLSYGRE